MIVFDASYNIIDNEELHISRSKNGTFYIKMYDFGKVIYKENTDLQYLTNDEIATILNEWTTNSKTRGLNFNCFTATIGGGGTIAALILKLCGAPCAVAPPICTVCLVGIVAVGGGSIITTVMNCWD